MSLVYKPVGRAQEFVESKKDKRDSWAINIYSGCPHRCAYCFVPCMPPWKFKADARERFHEQCKPAVDFKKLETQLKKLHQLQDPVHACFTCDPYPEGSDTTPTRRVLELFDYYKIENVQVLTKNGIGAERDFDLIGKNNWKFGTTIVAVNEYYYSCWNNHGLHQDGYEPMRSAFVDREAALQIAYDRGIHTWVSMEPVVFTKDALEVLEQIRPWVNLWKIGKLNHGSEISQALGRIEAEQDWRGFVRQVKKLLEPGEYMFKDGLLKYDTEN